MFKDNNSFKTGLLRKNLDVHVDNPTNTDYLKYDTTLQKWINAAVGGGGLFLFNTQNKVFADSPVAAIVGDFYLCDTTLGNIIVNLPAAALSLNYTIVVKKLITSGKVTVNGNIYDDPANTSWILTKKGETYLFISDGVFWYVW